ncbi:unnamed protein product, partial [marine sediment metagenome]
MTFLDDFSIGGHFPDDVHEVEAKEVIFVADADFAIGQVNGLGFNVLVDLLYLIVFGFGGAVGADDAIGNHSSIGGRSGRAI